MKLPAGVVHYTFEYCGSVYNIFTVDASVFSLLTFFTLVLEMVAMPFILRNLYRKLPGWMAAGGEEGAEKTSATEEAVPARSKPGARVAASPPASV